jgi:hypothetical protein
MHAIIYWTGIMFWVAVLACIVCVALSIIGNIYGGILGSYRLQRITTEMDLGYRRLTPWQHFRRGLRAWPGHRYHGEDRTGRYWDVAGMEIPVDGRDPVPETRFYGAGDEAS